MGDVTPDASAMAVSSTNEPSTKDEKQSIELLKKVKERADITNTESFIPSIASLDEGKNESEDEPPTLPAASTNIETVFENVGMDKTISSEAPLVHIPERPQELSSSMVSAESGRMNKLRDHTSNIFPAGIMGCKEGVGANPLSPRRFIDATEASKYTIGHIDNIPRKMPNSKSDHDRNPLTGQGMDASDEIKRCGSRKKLDGNPLLGVGYDKKMSSSSSSTRIPPGGFSHGLW